MACSLHDIKIHDDSDHNIYNEEMKYENRKDKVTVVIVSQ